MPRFAFNRLNAALLTLLFLLGNATLAQSNPYELKLNDLDGLASNETYGCFADSSGNLWILTERGLSRFDGRSLETKFTNRSFYRAFPLTDGAQLLSSGNGIHLFRNGAVEPIDIPLNTGVYTAFPINKLIEHEGKVTLIPEKISPYLYELDLGGKSAKKRLIGEAVYPSLDSLLYHKMQVVLVEVQVAGKGEVALTTLSKEKPKLPPGVRILAKDQDLPFSTKFGQSCSRQIKSYFWYRRLYVEGTTGPYHWDFKNDILSLFSSESSVYIGLRNVGLLRLDPASGALDTLFAGYSVAGIQCIHQRLWLSTLESGVFRVNPMVNELYSFPEGIGYNQLAKPLYFTASRFKYIDRNTLYSYVYRDKLKLEKQQRLTDPNHNFLLRAYWQSADTFYLNHFYYRSGEVDKSLPTGAQLLYAEQGILIYSLANRVHFLEKGEELYRIRLSENQRATSVAKHGGAWYFGTTNGLFKRDTLGPIKRLKGTLGHSIGQLVSFDGSLYAASSGKGLYRLKEGLFRPVEALTSKFVLDLLVDEKRQRLFIASDMGLQFLSPNGLSDLLYLRQVDELQMDGKELYFLSDERIHHLRVWSEILPQTKEPFAAPKMLYQGEAIPTDGVELEGLDNRLLLTFENRVGGLNYNQLRWKLVGDKGDYTQTEDLTLELTDIPEGKHLLEVQLLTELGRWTKAAQVPIYVSTPLVDRLWFWPVFFSLVASFILIGIYALVVQRQRALERERLLLNSSLTALKLQINPHFIFNALNSLQSLIVKGRNKEGSIFLDCFASMIRHMLDLSYEPYIPLENELEILRDFLNLESLRLDVSGVHFKVHNHTEFPTDQIRVPNFLLQPILENAIWHAFADHPGQPAIDLHVYREDEKRIRLEVQDNGKGIDLGVLEKKRQSGSIAIKNIEERLRLISRLEKVDCGIKLEPLNTHTTTGTRVTLILPLKFAT